jgi:phage protein D
MNVARREQAAAYAKYYEAGGAAGAKAPVFPAEQEKALAAEQLRLETSLTDKTMLRDDVEKTKTAIAEIAAARKSILGVGALAAGAKSAAKSASVRVEKGSIIIEENGAMGTLDDTPANRAELKAMGYDL